MDFIAAASQFWERYLLTIQTQPIGDWPGFYIIATLLGAMVVLLLAVMLLAAGVSIILEAVSTGGSLSRLFGSEARRRGEPSPYSSHSLAGALARGGWTFLYVAMVMVPVAVVIGVVILPEFSQAISYWAGLTLTFGIPLSLWISFAGFMRR